MKKTWLLRVAEIREELAAVEAPVLDRGMCERIFGVRRRRALQLMHYFGGWQSGQAYLVDRLALLSQLEPFEKGAELVMEQRRRQRLSDNGARTCPRASLRTTWRSGTSGKNINLQLGSSRHDGGGRA